LDVRTPSVHVHIEELVLDGFAPADRDRIKDGIARELRRLFLREIPPAWRRGESSPRLVAPATHLPRGAPERVGESIAAAAYAATTKKEPR
jgi:hypothetical protein